MNSPIEELREINETLDEYPGTVRDIQAVIERFEYQRDALLGLADHMQAHAIDAGDKQIRDQWVNQIRGILR
jgi:hypothetical protein